MRDETLLKISLLIATAGIAVLFALAQLESKVPIGKIDESHIGQTVKVAGEIKSLYRSRAGHAFLELVDSTGRIKVVIFEGSADADFLQEGQKIKIQGKVVEYRGRPEIIARKVIL
jgi:DNA/RNA endonuclease YhcR with UshA esterase domain